MAQRAVRTLCLKPLHIATVEVTRAHQCSLGFLILCQCLLSVLDGCFQILVSNLVLDLSLECCNGIDMMNIKAKDNGKMLRNTDIA